MRFFSSLRFKLQLPTMALGLVLLLFIILAVLISNATRQSGQDLAALRSDSGAVNEWVDAAEAFLQMDSEYTETTKAWNLLRPEVIEDFSLSTPAARLEDAKKLFEDDQTIRDRIFELTTQSIGNSNTYLFEVSKKLADPRQQATVSTLERLVIGGATVNTNAGYAIQVLYLEALLNPARLSELDTLLENGIKNASADVVNLAGTPFEGLPRAALAANTEIKNLVSKRQVNATQLEMLNTEMHTTLESVRSLSIQRESGALEQVFSDLRRLLLITSLITGGITILIALLQLRFSGRLSHRLAAGSNAASRIADGLLDTSLEAAGSDELSVLEQAIGQTAAKLREVVSEALHTSQLVAELSADLSQAMNQMSLGIGGISNSSMQLAQGSNEQAASAEEVSASIEEMSAAIRQNAENATETEKIARSAAKGAETGASAVQETVGAMREIAVKISIIEEIARQTNMLSLNASIEAARAGEHGKGFAVVAAEVGKLAERSKIAAGEISRLAGSSVAVAEHAGTTLSAILPEIQRTADLVQEINLASHEQDQGASQIAAAMTQLDSVIQNNASMSEEFSASSEELAGQAQAASEVSEELADSAEQLRAVVSYFKLAADNDTPPLLTAGEDQTPAED